MACLVSLGAGEGDAAPPPVGCAVTGPRPPRRGGPRARGSRAPPPGPSAVVLRPHVVQVPVGRVDPHGHVVRAALPRRGRDLEADPLLPVHGTEPDAEVGGPSLEHRAVQVRDDREGERAPPGPDVLDRTSTVIVSPSPAAPSHASLRPTRSRRRRSPARATPPPGRRRVGLEESGRTRARRRRARPSRGPAAVQHHRPGRRPPGPCRARGSRARSSAPRVGTDGRGRPWNASSPTARTSSISRTSGSTWTATAKPSRTYMPDE